MVANTSIMAHHDAELEGGGDHLIGLYIRHRSINAGHNGLFARQLPIVLPCFLHSDILGFCRRRFDLFAIVRFALQS
jgi:hypothetical protein